VKIQFCGISPVDIDGHSNVSPGDTIEVSDDLGARLLFAGSSVADDGKVTPPAEPEWVAAKPAKGTNPTEPAAAVKES